jgi:hypothetical protein
MDHYIFYGYEEPNEKQLYIQRANNGTFILESMCKVAKDSELTAR